MGWSWGFKLIYLYDNLSFTVCLVFILYFCMMYICFKKKYLVNTEVPFLYVVLLDLMCLCDLSREIENKNVFW